MAYFASEHNTGEALVRQMDYLGLAVSTLFQENKLAVYAIRESGGDEGPEERLPRWRRKSKAFLASTVSLSWTTSPILRAIPGTWR